MNGGLYLATNNSYFPILNILLPLSLRPFHLQKISETYLSIILLASD
jgi:hypothetical protein